MPLDAPDSDSPSSSMALLPSVLSTRQSHHPSLLHSFIPGLKPSFSANPSHCSFPSLLQDWLHGLPGLFTDTSDKFWAYSFYTFYFFSVFHFLVFASVWQIKLTYVSFWAHVKIASRIVSYSLSSSAADPTHVILGIHALASVQVASQQD